jgi:hypothetical protein
MPDRRFHSLPDFGAVMFSCPACKGDQNVESTGTATAKRGVTR